jgi:hypothetical protein
LSWGFLRPATPAPCCASRAHAALVEGAPPRDGCAASGGTSDGRLFRPPTHRSLTPAQTLRAPIRTIRCYPCGNEVRPGVNGPHNMHTTSLWSDFQRDGRYLMLPPADATRSQHPHLTDLGHRILQKGALANSRLAAQDKCTASAFTRAGDERRQQPALTRPSRSRRPVAAGGLCDVPLRTPETPLT